MLGEENSDCCLDLNSYLVQVNSEWLTLYNTYLLT